MTQISIRDHLVKYIQIVFLLGGLLLVTISVVVDWLDVSYPGFGRSQMVILLVGLGMLAASLILPKLLLSPFYKWLCSQAKYPSTLQTFSFWGICSQIGLTVIIIFFLGLGIELSTRLILGVPLETEEIVAENAAYAYHPWSEHRMTPGFTYQGMSINQRGWRGKEYSEEKPPGFKRVILLGDSVAFSSFSINDEVTIAGYLERILIERTGQSWEVINMAVPSGTGHKALATLAHEGIYFQPDFVVALNGNNDLAELVVDRSHELFPNTQPSHIDLVMEQLFDPRTARGVPSQNLQILLNESAFFRWLSQVQPPNKPQWPSEIEYPERLDQFVKSQVAIYYLTEGAGAKFIHFTQPYLSIKHKKIGPNEEPAIVRTQDQRGEGIFEFLDAAFPILQEKMQQAADHYGFRSVDLSLLFIEEDVFSDAVHIRSISPTEDPGNYKIALRMAEEILLELELD